MKTYKFWIEEFREDSRMINKIIWMYWNGGYESMSELSKMCVESWKVYNSDWEFRLVDDSSVSEYFDLEGWMKNTLPNDKPLLDGCKKSEVLRINLINKYAGVYADADVFVVNHLMSGFTI